MANEVESGWVAKLIRDKGFGFLSPATAGPDLFFHATAMSEGEYEKLNPYDNVTFVRGAGRDGRPAAAVVRRVA